MKRGWVLLDRDGTINAQTRGAYVLSPEAMVLLPNTAEGLRTLQDAGFGLVVVSNQAPVARGWISEAELECITARLEALLHGVGVELDAILYCLHDAGGGCDCRKPEPGLLLRAAQRFGFDLRRAFMIGDKASDIEAGRRSGTRTVLVTTGEGGEAVANGVLADHVCVDLVAAAAIIAGPAYEEAL